MIVCPYSGPIGQQFMIPVVSIKAAGISKNSDAPPWVSATTAKVAPAMMRAQRPGVDAIKVKIFLFVGVSFMIHTIPLGVFSFQVLPNLFMGNSPSNL